MPTSPPLPPFAHPVHFVCPDEMLWPELRGGFRSLSYETISRRCLDGTDCWIVRPWYELRKRGLDATISARPRSDAMNIASNRLTGRKFRALHPNAFLIIPRADGHVPRLANFAIRQNGVPSGSHEADIKHFGQPGLRPRNPGRGTRVETMHFKGDPLNLSKRFLTDDVIAAVTRLRENPAEYEAIVDYGRGRAHESSAEAICALWIEMLNGPAADAFEGWKVSSLATKISTATRALLEEPKSRAIYSANINMGKRILDTPLSELYPQISIPEMMARSGTEVH